MKTKFKSKLLSILLVLVMVLAFVPVSALTAFAASSVRVDFCLTNGALENNVFFENDSSKYFMSQQTKADGTLTSLEELYRTDNLDLEFDGWYTDKGEKVTLETVFTEYTIVYDRWKETTFTDEDIISDLEIGTPLLEVGEAAGTYGANSITLTDSRLSVEGVSVYEGLNAYRTNKLEDSDVLEAGKSYSLRVELHTKNGELIDDQLMSHSTATYGLVANMVYSHDNSGIFTTQWTNRENKIQVIINYDFENYYFTSDLEDKVVENGQSPQYTVYVSNNANVQGMELFVKNANDTWASLGAVTGQFNIPANSNVVKQYRVEVTYQNGFVISSNTFSVDWYDPDAPKFITQPTDYDVAYGTNVQVSWGLNFDSSSIVVERKNGETWVEYQSAYNDGAQISSMPESGTYTFRAHATKNGADYYSEEFTITWREKFVFTTQPQSQSVGAGLGEDIIITWDMDIGDVSLLQIFKIEIYDTSEGWRHFALLTSDTKSHTFSASDFAYSQKYRLMANYDGVLYYSDVFTIEFIAGEFTSKPDSTINAVVGNDCLVEWDFSFDVKYYNIKVYDGNDWVLFATTDKPEYNFTASEVGEKQYLVYAYNANDQRIGEAYLTFRINWKEQQIVYLVSFNANGGTGTMQPVEQNAGSQYKLPDCTFTAPNGKKFKAWSVNDVEKQVGDSITINANTVVKAVWEDNEVIYCYCTNGAEGSNEMGYATVGEEITLDSCTFTAPEGKRFKAWAIGSVNGEQKQPNEQIIITAETYIYAIWEDLPHECIGVIESGQGATCIVDGWKDYYRCECGKYYEDANCQTPINDLEAWKVGAGKTTKDHEPNADDGDCTTAITCSVCGTVTTAANATHTAGADDGDCTTAVKCTQCDKNAIEAKATHTGGTATCTQKAECTICGKEYGSFGDHNYGALIEAVAEKHTKTELVAGVAAHYQCSVCDTYFTSGKEATTLQALTGETPSHSYGAWQTNDDKHWKECSCGLKSEENDHVYDDATDVTCNTCDHDRTLPHTHGNGVKQDGQSATCTVDGWNDYYKCSCGKFYTEAACTNEITDLAAWKTGAGKIEASHNYGTLVSAVAQKHTQTELVAGVAAHYHCSACGKYFTEGKVETTLEALTGTTPSHSYGDWKTDADKHWKECSCGKKADEGNHVDANSNNKCDSCDKTLSGGVTPPPHTHDYGTTWKSDGTNHWKECSCGDKKEVTAHSGGTATCEAKAKCSECNTEYGELAEHKYSEATCTAKAKCSVCGDEKGELAAHTYVDGKCACGATDPNYVPPHEHNFVEGKCECGETDPNYQPPHEHNFIEGKCECGETDPNYTPGTDTPGTDVPGTDVPGTDKPEDPDDGLSGGAIAGIVAGSVVVLGGGGFALWWFVFRKRKLI